MKLISQQCIWLNNYHNAFPDLIRFQNKFWCCFREGEKHVLGEVGKIRILYSKDGKEWHHAALLSETLVDLRDPKLSIKPSGELYLLVGAVQYDLNNQPLETSSLAYLSKDGLKWSSSYCLLAGNEWLWRITWLDNKAYGISYRCSKDEWFSSLWQSEDGFKFTLVTQLSIPGFPSEATLQAMPDGRLIALVRRQNNAWLGESLSPSYKKWTWQELECHIGGPDFLISPDEKLIIGGRIVNDKTGRFGKTAISTLEGTKITEQLELPSSGDNSYPGMLFYENNLWVAYYSSHEGSTAIYLAIIDC